MLPYLITLVLGGLLGWTLAGRSAMPLRRSSGPTIEQVQRLASLVTARVQVADVLCTAITGYTGQVRIAVLVKGDFLLGVDLGQARFEDVDDQARTAVLVLPAPQVTSPRVDHERTRIFAIDTTGLWQLLPSDARRAELVEQAMREAQTVVADAAGYGDLMAQARHNAELLLGGFFQEALGWDITIRWQDEQGAAKTEPDRPNPDKE